MYLRDGKNPAVITSINAPYEAPDTIINQVEPPNVGQNAEQAAAVEAPRGLARIKSIVKEMCGEC